MCDKWWLESLGGERREIRSLNELEKFFGMMDEKCLGYFRGNIDLCFLLLNFKFCRIDNNLIFSNLRSIFN